MSVFHIFTYVNFGCLHCIHSNAQFVYRQKKIIMKIWYKMSAILIQCKSEKLIISQMKVVQKYCDELRIK